MINCFIIPVQNQMLLTHMELRFCIEKAAEGKVGMMLLLRSISAAVKPSNASAVNTLEHGL